MEKRKKIGFAMGISAAVLWGTFGTFSTFMYDYGLSEGTISLIAPLFLAVFFFILVAKMMYIILGYLRLCCRLWL